jgi:transketolase
MHCTIPDLERKAKEIRREMLSMCIKAKKGHVTSSLSSVDILVALYYGGILRHDPKKPDWGLRDRLILSKGQASPAYYTVLADRGFFPSSDLKKFAQKGGRFGVHLQQDVPGVEITAGSLGQGFGAAAGMALGAKMDRSLYMVYALLGDGECYEGSIWETAMFAAHNRLNNLVTIIDRNYLCVTDFTENLIELEPLDDKWASFGFNVVRVDGHSFEQLLEVLTPLRSRCSTRPTVVIADTVKGKGCRSLCHDPYWHGLTPLEKDGQRALQELEEENKYE